MTEEEKKDGIPSRRSKIKDESRTRDLNVIEDAPESGGLQRKVRGSF